MFLLLSLHRGGDEDLRVEDRQMGVEIQGRVGRVGEESGKGWSGGGGGV